MLKRAGVFSIVVVAATGQFPFTYEPLEESAHSNKVFINVKNIKEVAGVWKAINVVYHTYLNEGYLYDGVSQFNMSCEQALAGGWDYDYYIRYPRAATIEVDEYRREDGLLGHIIESRFAEIQRFGITDFSYLESIMTLDTGACRKMRPYFDWEVDKVMTLRSIRYYYYPDENGVTKHNELESCIYADVDHPQCFDTVFELDGQTHTGVVVDVPVFLECIAGPCLDLPFSIPGYSRTQGYVPPAAVEQSTPWTSNAGK